MTSTAGYSGTPLPKKLGIKEGTIVTLVAPPDSFAATLGELPTGAEILSDLGPADVVVMFAIDRTELEDRFTLAMGLIPADGAIWVAWPKKSSSLESELSFDVVQPYGLSTGLVDNKVCAIDDTWSGLRFVVRKENRSAWPERGGA